MNTDFVNLTTENLVNEHLCCIIRSKKAHPGIDAKRKWLSDRLNEGHVFRKLNAKATVFIEYAPLETAWVSIYHNDRKIGYCLYGDCFSIKDLEEERHDFKSLYGDVTAKNHTYEIGYLIGEEGYLNKGIGKIIIQLLEAKLIGIGAKEMVADPCEENVISVKTLLGNGFKKKSDGDYRKVIS